MRKHTAGGRVSHDNGRTWYSKRSVLSSPEPGLALQQQLCGLHAACFRFHPCDPMAAQSKPPLAFSACGSTVRAQLYRRDGRHGWGIDRSRRGGVAMARNGGGRRDDAMASLAWAGGSVTMIRGLAMERLATAGRSRCQYHVKSPAWRNEVPL
ncbi:hypothetical protein Q7P37_007228 [Cladosporium fusiforme]